MRTPNPWGRQHNTAQGNGNYKISIYLKPLQLFKPMLFVQLDKPFPHTVERLSSMSTCHHSVSSEFSLWGGGLQHI